MQNISEQLLPIMQNTVELLFGSNFNSNEFVFIAVTAGILLLLIGKVVNTTIGSSTRGAVTTLVGLLLPLVIALTSYSFTELYGSNYVTDPTTLENLCIAVASICTLFTLLIVAPFFLGIGPFKTLVVALFTYFLTVVGTYYVDQGITNFYSGKKDIHLNPEHFN